jgi:hypothetical protein
VLSVVLSAIILLMSSAFIFVLAYLLQRISHQRRFSRRRAYQIVAIVFVAVLMSFNDDPPARSLKNYDWSIYHHDNAHTGYTATESDPRWLLPAWTTNLDGAVYAEPLVIGGRVIVATEGDTIFSLDADTGQVQWHITVGHPVPMSTLNCGGNIDLLGITGTPVYDPASGLVFAVAEVTGPRHLLVGVDVHSGRIRVQRLVDVPAMNPPRIYEQRPALALSHGMIYIAFGGLADDCGTYHGTIVASRTDGARPLLSYQVPTVDSGGFWGASGPVIDVQGQVYVTTGNEDHASGKWDFSNAVLRLSPELQLEDRFAPTDWLAQDTGDQDLGSMGPSLLPGGFIFIAGKAGVGYLLHANALGGIGGQAAMARICDGLAMGGAAMVGSQILVPCSDGLRCVLVGPGPKLTVQWHASAAPPIALPPVIGRNTVYSLDQEGTLYALDLATGRVRAQLTLGVVIPHFATPAISDRRLFGIWQGFLPGTAI